MAKEFFDEISIARTRFDKNYVSIIETDNIEKNVIHNGKIYTKSGKTYQQHSRLWQITKLIQLALSLNPFAYFTITFKHKSYKKYIHKLTEEFITGYKKISLYILQECSLEHQIFNFNNDLPAILQPHFLNVVKNMDIDFRNIEMIRVVHVHFRNISNHIQKNYIIPLIQEIPPNHLKLYAIEQIFSLFHGMPDKPSQLLFNEIISVPQSDRENFILQLSLLFDGITSDHQQTKMLGAIQKIPQQDKSRLINRLNPLLIGIQNSAIRSYTFQILLKVHRHSKTNIISPLLEIFKKVHENTLIDWMTESIYSIPKEHREFFILQTSSLLPYISDGYKRAAVLGIIALIPPNFLTKDLLFEIPSLFQSTLIRDHKNIIDKIKKFPPYQRSTIIHLLKPIVENIYANDFRNIIIQAILNIAEEDRVSTLETATPFLSELPDSKDRFRILKYIWMIAPKKRLMALQLAKTSNALDNSQFILTIFADDEIREASHEHLYDLLEASITDRSKAEALAENIINYADKILLNEEQPLFNRAIEVLSLTDTATMDSLKNAYALFSGLKKTLATEPLISYSLPQFPFDDRSISLNLSVLRQRGEIKNAFDDFPAGISPDTFKFLFEKMEKRIKALSLKEQLLLCEYTLNSYGTNFSELKTNLLSKPLISSLLRIKGIPTQPAELTSYYLHIIAKRILETPDQCLPPSILTEQEEMLLAFSSSVQNCPIGQKDGISIFYNRIYHLPFRGESAADTIESIVDNSIQTLFHDILTSNEFLEELIESTHFSQEAHQTLYLKNRFHKQIGLRHRLAFDPYGAVIDESLLYLTSENMIKKFFTFCLPEKVIAQVKRDILEFQEKKYLKYSDLAVYLENILTAKEKENTADWYHHYLHFRSNNPQDEGYEAFEGISDHGVVAILKELNYFKLER